MEAIPKIPDFEIIRRIGGGSYGDVWIGRSVTGVYRAIKIVERTRFADDRPFAREFEGISRFQKTAGNRPRQLALLHVGYDEPAGFLYYVMELADDAVAGTDIDPATYVPLTLKELRVRRKAALPAPECIKLAVELAGALADLHDAGLIHRDIKPSNIIFVSGVPKLADVGLIASSDESITSLGTVGYAPPEGGGTAQADIYSLGKMIYEMLSGCPPGEFPRIPIEIFSGESSTEALELNEVILHACDPSPAERYQRTRAMLDDLLLLQAGRSVQELYRAKRRFQSLKKISLVLGLVAAVALAFAGVVNYRALRRVAAQETALRKMAQADEQQARYISNLHLAQLGWMNEDYGITRNALRREIPQNNAPDLRGPEWWALWNETAGDAEMVLGKVGNRPVRSLALSQRGDRLIAQTGDDLQFSDLWDLTDRTLFPLHQATLGAAGFSADDTVLYLGDEDRKISAFDIKKKTSSGFLPITGRILQSLDHGRKLLISDHGPTGPTLTIWDTIENRAAGKWRAEGMPLDALTAATASLDGRYLAASLSWADGAERRRKLIVYDMERQSERFHLDHVQRVQAVTISGDDRLLAVAILGWPIGIYAMDTGQETLQLAGQREVIHALAFSPDNRELASAGADKTLRIWDIVTGKVTGLLRGHESDVNAVAWTNDGSELITGGADGTCRSWRLPPRSKAQGVGGLWSDNLGDFVFSRGGQSIAVTNSEGEILSYSTKDLKINSSSAGGFQPLEYLDGDLEILALTKRAGLAKINILSGAVMSLDLLRTHQKITVTETSPTAALTAFGFETGEVEIHETIQGKQVRLLEPGPDVIGALSWSHAGEKLAVGGWSGNVLLLSNGILSPLQLLLRDESRVTSLAFTPDDQLLAVGRYNGRISLWSFRENRSIGDFIGHSAYVSSLVFSPEGNRLISGGSDGVVSFWALPSQRQVAAWTLSKQSNAPEKGIYRLKFDRSGKQLGAMTEGGHLLLWSLSRDSL